MSGFYNGGDAYVVYGKRRNEKVALVPIEIVDDITALDECGMYYSKYSLEDSYEDM